MSGDLLIDISAAVNQSAGIGRYARELTQQLIPILGPDQTRLWFAEEDCPYDPGLPGRTPWADLPMRRSPISRLNVDRLLVRQSIPIQRLLRVGKPADIYSPDFTAPAPKQTRSHITVHDLAWLHPEAQTPDPLARFLGPVVERSVRLASTVFTVSSAIRDEVVRNYAISPEQVVVAPNAAAPPFFQAQPFDDDALVTFGLRRPFFLAVGTIEPRKNLPVLFEAMAMLGAGTQLVLIGRAGWGAPEILGRVDELGLSGRIVRLGFVPDDSLPRLMASAAAVVYPSRYEGFGLPVVEALATGAPVVASNLPVFHEVGGDVVTYVDPSDPVELASALECARSQPGAAEDRQARVARARHFDWQSSAAIVAQRLQEFD
jgi:glycosyltransferase involved in cell wall biosynthesis